MIDIVLLASGPLILSSLGALLTELSGALGLFIEGFMNIGSFSAYFFAVKTGSALLSYLMTVVFAFIIGLSLSSFVFYTKANPFISALGFNLLAEGLCARLSSVFFGTKGVVRTSSFPMTDRFLGLYIAACVVLVTALLINRTVIGPRLISCGREESSAYERGIHTKRYKIIAWTAAGVLASLSGAVLTFRIGSYTPGGAAGRGWVALACVYLGFRSVWGTFSAALLFAFVEYIGYSVQVIESVPSTVLLGLPSGLALFLYALSCRRGKLRRP